MWMILIILLLIAPMLFRAWMGWAQGAVAETRQTLVQLFAVLVALRYLQLITEWFSGLVSFDPRYVAAVTFVGLYAIAAVVAGFVVQIKAEVFQSVNRDYINQGVGVLLGLFSGSLIGGVLLLLAGLVIPPQMLSTDSGSPGGIMRWPIPLVQTVERSLAGIRENDPARIRYPEVKAVEEDAGEKSGEESDEPKLKLVWN